MITLIGGAPRCGKSTLAQDLAGRRGIPHVPADYLTSVMSPYIPNHERQDRTPRWYARMTTQASNDRLYSTFPPAEIVGFYRQEAETYWPGLRNFIVYALSDKKDFVIEGVWLRPDHVRELMDEVASDSITAIFLGKTGVVQIEDGLRASTLPNDWAQRNTGDSTYTKIAEMIDLFSGLTRAECLKYDLPAHDVTHDFHRQIDDLARTLDGA